MAEPPSVSEGYILPVVGGGLQSWVQGGVKDPHCGLPRPLSKGLELKSAPREGSCQCGQASIGTLDADNGGFGFTACRVAHKLWDGGQSLFEPQFPRM